MSAKEAAEERFVVEKENGQMMRGNYIVRDSLPMGERRIVNGEMCGFMSPVFFDDIGHAQSHAEFLEFFAKEKIISTAIVDALEEVQVKMTKAINLWVESKANISTRGEKARYTVTMSIIDQSFDNAIKKWSGIK